MPSLLSWKGKALAGGAVGALTWIAVLSLYLAGFLEPFELKFYDHFSRWYAERTPAPDDIALVAVDQGSLEAGLKHGINWPWPRQMYAPIAQFCSLSGARAVVFDILYEGPSTYGVEDDKVLAEAFQNSGRVILPVFLSNEDHQTEPWATSLMDLISLSRESSSPPPSLSYRSVQMPQRLLAESAAGLGNVNIAPDPDGIFRRLPLFSLLDHRFIPVLGLEAVRRSSAGSQLTLGPGGLHLGGRKIPLDPQSRFLLTYYGGEPAYPRYSAFNVIQSYLASQEGGKPIYPVEVFRDKIVLVGYTAPGLYELKPTPVSAIYPGMSIHATLAANLVHQDFRVRVNPGTVLPLSAATAIVTGASVMLLASLWQLILFPLVYFAGLGLLATIFFAHCWVDTVFPGLSFALAFAFTSLLSYTTEGKQRRFIKRMFSHYMSESLIQDLLRNPHKLRLGGEKRLLSIFFSDLAGFTSISEMLKPEEVVALINRYLTAMTNIILAHGGLIDKYEGDAIMAFWGAPVTQEDHAARACLAALENQERLRELRDEFRALGLPSLHARIGINTGEVIIGNMGSHQRFDFTVMGDTVNLASRLEGAGKAYKVNILLSEETYRQAADFIEARELDLLQVKGRATPVRIYELLARKGEVEHLTKEVCGHFAEGLRHYRSQEWIQAVHHLEQALKLKSDDGPSTVFLERCHEFMESPPPSPWDGVYRLTTK